MPAVSPEKMRNRREGSVVEEPGPSRRRFPSHKSRAGFVATHDIFLRPNRSTGGSDLPLLRRAVQLPHQRIRQALVRILYVYQLRRTLEYAQDSGLLGSPNAK